MKTGILAFLKRATNLVQKALEIWCFSCCAAILCIVLLQIFARSLFQFPIPWALGTSQLLFINISYLGAVIVYGMRSHISINLFAEKLPKKVRIFLEAFITVLIQLTFIFWTYTLYCLIMNSRGVYPSPSVPIQVYYLPAFVTAILCLFYSTIDVIELFSQWARRKAQTLIPV